MPLREERAKPGEAMAIPVVRQCRLAGVARATLYGRARAHPRTENAEDLSLLRLIDEQYTRRPFYGSRRMVVYLREQGWRVNRKRVQRLMRLLGLIGMAPGPNTSRRHPQHKVYPYLLRGLEITRPNQVWSADITYIRLERGFAYLVAIIDWYSRKVLGWRISNTLDAGFCVDCLEEAIKLYGKPENFNTDQGVQFTCAAWIGVLEREGITISMDGRGRALDNIFVERLWRSVKHEDVYLKGYGNIAELILGLSAYFTFYNAERPHQSLGYKTPDKVYTSATGGGASIPDHFGDALLAAAATQSSVPLRSTALCYAPSANSATATATATPRSTTVAKPGQRRPAATEVMAPA
jgi:putative transposase